MLSSPRRDVAHVSSWTDYVRDVDIQYSDWTPDPSVSLEFGGAPVGMPNQYKAIESVGGGFAAVLPSVQVIHNTAWINYWYNQQQFINYSLDALGLVRGQLQATSIMAARNRFAIDQMRAPDEGVCTMVGAERCAITLLHTGTRGALTKVLTRLKQLQEEHIHNTGFTPPIGLRAHLGFSQLIGHPR